MLVQPKTMPEPFYIDQLELGQSREMTRIVTQEMIAAFADISNDHNPVHLDADYASTTVFGGIIAHGMLTASFISAVIAGQLPGAGTIYLGQSLRFRAPVKPGDEVVAKVKVLSINEAKRRVTLECSCVVGDRIVLDGQAEVLAPVRPE